MIANEMKKGTTFVFNGDVHECLSYSHEKPGKGGAFVVAKIKNWKTGKIFENRFRSNEKLEDAFIDKRTMQYSYRDGANLVFMDTSNWEQTEIPAERLGDDVYFLKEETEVLTISHQGTLLGVRLPEAVVLTITKADPAVKGDTSSGATKTVEVETGYTLQGPLFLSQGEKIKVDTRTGQYLERA